MPEPTSANPLHTPAQAPSGVPASEQTLDAAAPPSSGTLVLPPSFLAELIGLTGADLLRRLKEDQRLRWKRGERFLAEFYREKMPSLHDDVEGFLDLVCSEMLLRQESGETPDLDEYRRRLPEHADALLRLLDRRHELGNGSRDSSKPSGFAQPTSWLAGAPQSANAAVRVPGYEILCILGRGGMGVVYKARHLKLNRIVALKMILSGGHASPADLQRFVTEGEAVAALQHPNIVQIFETGEHQGLPYFSLEYVDSGSLAAKVKEAPLTPKEAAAIVEHLARGMDYAHKKGVVHRDLKPDNVLLTGDGVPKLTDFGLAKRVKGDSGLTQTGAIMGTPSYMAPEQAGGKPSAIGPGADVYGLGAILYRLVTGRPPFQAATAIDTIMQVVNDEPVAPTQLQSKTPRDLETIILKCLRKEPAKRYASAGDLADDLRRFQENRPIVARPLGRVRKAAKWVQRNPGVTVLVTLIVLLIVGGSTGIYVKYREAKDNEALALKNGRDAREQEAEAKKQEAEAKRQEAEAKRQEGIADADRKELRYNLALDKILLAQPAFESKNVPLARELLGQAPPELRRWEWHYLRWQFEGGIFTLYGHSARVSSVGFSPDGTRIVTGSFDKTAKVWDAKNGSPLLELKGHTDEVSSVGFSPDGTRIVTGSWDKTAKVWDAKNGNPLLELKGHTSFVVSVGFSPDGTRIVTGSFDTVDDRVPLPNVSAKVWDAKNGNPLLELKGHTDVVWSVGFSPDGTRIVTGSGDKTAKVWDAKNGNPLLELKGHAWGVSSVGFSPDGTRIVTGSGDKTAKVWDAKNGNPLFELKDTNGVMSVGFSPDGTRIVTSGDKTAKVWDTKNGNPLLELKGHTSIVVSAGFSPDSTRIVTGSDDMTAKVWDAKNGSPLLELKGHTDVVTSIGFGPDGTRIVTGSDDMTAKVWDAKNGKPMLELKGHTREVSSVGFSPDGTRIVTGSFDKTAKVWDAKNGNPLLELKGHTGVVWSVGFSPDGTRIVTGSSDTTFRTQQENGSSSGIAKVWDAKNGKPMLELKGHTREVSSVGFSPDGTRIVTGSGDKTAKVWDAKNGNPLLELKRHTGVVSSVGFSPDGTRIVTGSDKTAKVWDAKNGNPLLELKGHISNVSSVGFSPDGTRIVTSGDGTAKVWDAKNGKALLELKGHTAGFSPDGTRIVTCSDKTVKVRDAKIGNPLLELMGHTDVVTSVGFSPDGTRIVTGSGDMTAKVWDAKNGNPLLELKGHTDVITSVGFSPDGTRIVTGSGDMTAKVWDAKNGNPLLELKGHTDVITNIGFSPDGTRIVTGSGDMTAKVWDAKNGNPLLELKGHAWGVSSVGFSPDGTRIYTRDIVKTVKVWSAQNGVELSGAPVPAEWDSAYTSPDGRYFAHRDGNRVVLIDRQLSPEELSYRLFWTRPRPDLHEEEFAKAVADKDAFAARFHLDRLLAYQPEKRLELLERRLELQPDDWLVLARTAVHSPGVGALPALDAVMFRAARWDPLALRSLGGALLRKSQPTKAIVPLRLALLLRQDDRPPVEELLLALAYLDARQPEEAAQWHAKAVAWLDREKKSVAEGKEPAADLRYNAFDWETWYECEVFRAEYEAKRK